MALPLIPLNKIEAAFEETQKKAPGSIKPLFRYFRAYWMTKVKIDLWHVSDLNVRTNSCVEGEFLYSVGENLSALLRMEPPLQSSSKQAPSERMALFRLCQGGRGFISATDTEDANRWREEKAEKGSGSSNSYHDTRLNVRSEQNRTRWAPSRIIFAGWCEEVISELLSKGFLCLFVPL